MCGGAVGALITLTTLQRRTQMKRYIVRLLLFSMLCNMFALGLGAPRPAFAAGCAFVDVNDNGVFDGGDIPVADSQWIGADFTTTFPFVVPAGCPAVNMLAIGSHVQVTATKITFLGELHFLKGAGDGFVLRALKPGAGGVGDGSITIGNGVAQAITESGGQSSLFPVTTPAVYLRSIALYAEGKCTLNNATLRGFVPTGSTDIGIFCQDDIKIRTSTIVGDVVNIQSLGKIDARSSAAFAAALSVGDICDAKSATPNGVLDPSDFPCVLDPADVPFLGLPRTFNNLAELNAFCGVSPLGGANVFQAFNDPLIMIAGGDLDVGSGAGGSTILFGKTGVRLSSENGNVNTSLAFISTGDAGGAGIYVFAHPKTVVRLPDDHEDFTGPSTGSVNIAGACYVISTVSHNLPNIGSGSPVSGTPSAALNCAQFPLQFLRPPSKNF